MASEADRNVFLLRDVKRLQIAEWCDQQPRTHGELAGLLEIEPSRLSAPRTMASSKWKALTTVGKGSALRYKLTRSWRPAVQKAREQIDLEGSGQQQEVLGGVDLLL